MFEFGLELGGALDDETEGVGLHEADFLRSPRTLIEPYYRLLIAPESGALGFRGSDEPIIRELYQIKHLFSKIHDDKASLEFIQKGLLELKNHIYTIPYLRQISAKVGTF